MKDSWRLPNEGARIECLECGCPAALPPSIAEPMWECPNCGNGFVRLVVSDQ